MTNEELKTIREISIHRILSIHESGRRISLRCPFPNHRDGTPSFTLYPTNDFYCFGCGASGRGAIDFVTKLGYTFVEACQELIKYL